MTYNDFSKKDMSKLFDLYTQLIGYDGDFDKMISVLKEIQSDEHYSLFCVYTEKEELIATATLSKCLDLTADARYYYAMENFVVDALYRRNGVGTFLMKSIEQYVKKNNGSYISFTSSAARHVAHSFYEKLGYEKDYVKGFKKRFEK